MNEPQTTITRRAFLAHSALATSSLTLVGTAGRAVAQDEASSSFPVSIYVDAGKPVGPLRPIWRFFGADEPNYATMKNGKKLLGELGQMAPKARVLPRPQSVVHR